MTIEEYFKEMNPGYVVSAGSEAHLVMHELSQKALQITMEINNKYHTPEEIVGLMSELTGHEVDPSFGLFPPFYTDCGRNIHLGKKVFINAGCKFQDQGGIYIDDGALIGHNVVLATINHMEDPNLRGGMIFKPIHIGKNVWIGANATMAFRMFTTDEAVEVSLLCDNVVMKSIVDKFGMGISTRSVGKDKFRVKAKVCTGPTFYRWIFGSGGKIKIEGPEEVRDEYREMLKQALDEA